MTFGVDRGFVDPWVQGGDIDVMDLLVGGHAMVQFHGIGTPSTKRIPRIEWGDESQVLNEGSDVGRGITGGTSMPETTLEFVDRLGVGAITIHEPYGGDVNLPGIAHMFHVLAKRGMRMVWIGLGHPIMLFQILMRQGVQGLLTLLVIAQG